MRHCFVKLQSLSTVAAFVLLTVAMLLIGAGLPGAQAGKHEKRLLRDLFENKDENKKHNPMERPVENDSAVLYVWFKVSLQQIIDVDEKNQILFSNIWLDLTWSDYHFKWNPADYGNITKINIDPSRVWKPDILLYNSADEKFDGTFPTNVVINHSGSMNYIPPGMFKSTCKIDITWFPFDTQKCELKFGSWTYDGGTVDLRFKCDNASLDTTEKILQDPEGCSEKGSGDVTTYVESGEWNLEGMPGIRTALVYDCCPFPFIDLKYWIKIRRRTLYYGFNLIIPCVLISSMALLTFMLPPDAGEKISLGVTILLSLTMFLLLVADAMPQTSEALPLIGMYFACTMIMCSLSVVFTVIVLNYHHRDAESHPIPNWVRQFICTYLASILCMRRLRRDEDAEPIRLRRRRTRSSFAAGGGAGGSKMGAFRSSASAASGFAEHHRELLAAEHAAPLELRERSSKSLLANVLDLEDNFRAAAAAATSRLPPVYDDLQQQQRQQQQQHPNGQFLLQQQQQQPCSLRSDLESIVNELRIITQKISDDVADGEVSSEWKFAARVVDRLCLILFSCFTVISTCAILFSAPDVFKG